MQIVSQKRIVILGDSLGLPRPEGETPIAYEDTYPYLLKNLLPDWEIISACKRANNAKKQSVQQSICDDILYLNPSIVIIHLGIVDCAPRLFTAFENQALNKLPKLIREKIVAHFSKYRDIYTKIFKKVYVRKEEYKAGIEKIIKASIEIGAIPLVIGIADTNQRNKGRSYNYDHNIRSYNEVLLELSRKYLLKYIEMYEKGEGVLLPDGIHLNKTANRWLAENIVNLIPAININIPDDDRKGK